MDVSDAEPAFIDSLDEANKKREVVGVTWHESWQDGALCIVRLCMDHGPGWLSPLMIPGRQATPKILMLPCRIQLRQLFGMYANE